MLKIKLARFGKKKQPHYRIVVNEARDKRDGKYVDIVGHYAPTFTPKILEVNLDKYKEWMKKGAQPTDTVMALIARIESGNPFPAKKAKLSKKAKAKLAAEAEAAAQPKEEAAPAPVEETAAEVVAEEAAPTEEVAAEAPAAE
jgi:small subunit ribosomal protein S16